MKRNVDISEISDGRLYGLNDMVKAGCDGCKNCSACCKGMGNTVVLDPVDVHRLTSNLGCTFEELLLDKLELNVVDGLILPNLKMNGENEACHFLDENGRCSIHSFRPGICRLFPLGRLYENGSFSYFLQVHECPKENKTKVKVKNWLDIPDIKSYENFVTQWHYMLKDLEELISIASEEETKTMSMYILKEFYIKPYNDNESIYEQIKVRIDRVKNAIGK